MSDPGNHSPPWRGRNEDFEAHLAAQANGPFKAKTPRPVTVEDASDDGREDTSNATEDSHADTGTLDETSSTTSVSSAGTRNTGHATVGPAEEKLNEQLSPGPQYASPRPQRRLGPNAHVLREHPVHQHNQHHRPLHPLAATQPEVFNFLDNDPPNGMHGGMPPNGNNGHFIRRSLRNQQGQFPPEHRASPGVRSPASSVDAFGNAPFSPPPPNHHGRRPPASDISTWAAPEHWSEGPPPPFYNQGPPPGAMMQNGPNGVPLGMPPYGGPGSPPMPPQGMRSRRRGGPPGGFEPHGQELVHRSAYHDGMSGYNYLCERLAGSLFGPPITPIYRRFEALGHRILLKLQDELCQLEEELDSIDQFENKTRQASGSLMPASTRAAARDDHPVARQRLDVIAAISEKLDMYYAFLKMFRDAQCMPRPTINEVDSYGDFLMGPAHIVDEETKFLSRTDDHLSLPTPGPPSFLSRKGARGSETSEPTPVGSPTLASSMTEHAERKGRRRLPPAAVPEPQQVGLYLAYGLLAAVLVPVMTFPVFSGFAERLVIIAMVFAGVGWAMWQAGVLREGGDVLSRPTEAAACAGAYVVTMAVAARVCN